MAANARSSLILKALNTMAMNTHMCGIHPCSEVLQNIMQRVGWKAFGAIALVILITPNILFWLLRMSLQRGLEEKERYVQSKNHRFGVSTTSQKNAPFYDLSATSVIMDDDMDGSKVRKPVYYPDGFRGRGGDGHQFKAIKMA